MNDDARVLEDGETQHGYVGLCVRYRRL